jgi:hypothetical protein
MNIIKKLVKEKEESYYEFIKSEIIKDMITFIIEKKYIIVGFSPDLVGINDIQLDNNETIFTLYGKNTSNFVIDFVNFLYNKFTEGETIIKIYSKRVNLNTIIINFGKCPLLIRLININHDLHFLNSNNNIGNPYLFLHSSFHSLSFPEIYNFINNGKDIIKMHELWEESIIKKIKINKKLPFRNIKIKEEIKKIINNGEYNNIIIGSLAIQKVYKLNYNIINYPEIICSTNFSDLLNNFKKNKYKYTIYKSDFEFFNISFVIYSKENNKKILIRVYKGDNFCYPYHKINNIFYGSYSILMKYFILHLIDNRINKYSLEFIIKKLFNIQKKEGGIINSLFPYCLGDNKSSYKIYYLNNWGNKPWNYSKKIYF